LIAIQKARLKKEATASGIPEAVAFFIEEDTFKRCVERTLRLLLRLPDPNATVIDLTLSPRMVTAAQAVSSIAV